MDQPESNNHDAVGVSATQGFLSIFSGCKQGLTWKGRLAVEGIKRAGKNPIREKFVSALEDDYELGGFRLQYTPNSRSGSRFTDMTVIGRDARIVR